MGMNKMMKKGKIIEKQMNRTICAMVSSTYYPSIKNNAKQSQKNLFRK